MKELCRLRVEGFSAGDGLHARTGFRVHKEKHLKVVKKMAQEQTWRLFRLTNEGMILSSAASLKM